MLAQHEGIRMGNNLHGFAIVTHGGAGEPLEFTDGAEKAAQRGREMMRETGDALDAAIAAVVVFEEDERFNAGTGSVLCLDGETLEMDASVMDTRGRLAAVAGSTGGSAPSLLGRVGDTAVIGSGFYAGPLGAVAATGVGEHIMRTMLARTVYAWIEQGLPLQQALQRGIDLIDKDVDTGLIAVTKTEAASCSNTKMPTGKIVE
jgi:isoaspartyl peptidase/L-asparaginase-like protein (Ntn-hydrolase superfamily)